MNMYQYNSKESQITANILEYDKATTYIFPGIILSLYSNILLHKLANYIIQKIQIKKLCFL